jgi:hypothetical protein
MACVLVMSVFGSCNYGLCFAGNDFNGTTALSYCGESSQELLPLVCGRPLSIKVLRFAFISHINLC